MLAKELAAILMENPDNYVVIRDVRYSEPTTLDIIRVKVGEDGETNIDGA